MQLLGISACMVFINQTKKNLEFNTNSVIFKQVKEYRITIKL